MLGYKFRGLTATNRRRDRRIPVALPAEANGGSILLKDISLGGLAFTTDDAHFEIGDDILIELDVSGFGCVKIGATVVRTDGKHEFGAAFIGLSSCAFKLIESLELGQFRRVLRVA